MRKKNRTATILIIVLAVAAGAIFFWNKKFGSFSNPFLAESPTPLAQDQPILPPPKPKDITYTTLTLASDDPIKELTEAVGKDAVDTVLRINRIDDRFLKQGSVLTVPSDTDDYRALSPFPARLEVAQSIPKLLLISQRVQAFGVYESGALVRWGPVSSGKQSTPTPSKLYFANWKGKEVVSTADDEWILKWNFNLDNFDGIGMHQYEMPGHPASHSCVRLLEADARWLYDWTQQWILARDGQTLLAHGTPVLIFGEYDFDVPAPWKTLPEDSKAATLSLEEITEALSPQIANIEAKQIRREEVEAGTR